MSSGWSWAATAERMDEALEDSFVTVLKAVSREGGREKKREKEQSPETTHTKK